MSSLKMTFSLASLVLMVALVFCMTADAEELERNVGALDLTGTLTARSFAIVTNGDMHGIVGGNPTDGAAEIPDLVTFFAKGGTISLLGPAKAGEVAAAEKHSVVISEIMWGRDTNQASVAAYSTRQWIELYSTKAPVADVTTDDVDLTTFELVFTEGRPVPDSGDDLSGTPVNPDADPLVNNPERDGMVIVDQVSNVDVTGWVVNIGQSGRIPGTDDEFAATPLISMYRKLDYAKIEKTHDKDNRKTQLSGVNNGNVSSGWAVSSDTDTFAPGLVGSPGEKHFVGLSIVGATKPTYAVIINEIGNNEGKEYDWVELRNTTDAEVNLKNWEISEKSGDAPGGEKRLVHFPGDDKTKIPAKGILLIVNSDPYNDPNHPLAAGARINGAHLDTTATASRYYVDSGLELMDAAGKTLLILRSHHEKKNSANNIVDLVGTNYISDNSAGFSTNLWPLKATGAGNDNVIDGTTEEDFRKGKVYQRNDATGGTGEKDFAVRGYTGIGYKRGASDNAQNGGTPGFDNGAIKGYNDKDATVSAAPVTISEIMYETGRNLPQWIELYNSSVTQAVTIGDWKVTFENADDVGIRTPAVTTEKLPGMVILPNQTLLVVSTTTGRSSGDFPKARIVDLWLSDKDTFEVETVGRRYKLLSTEAFRITVMDKAGKVVDTAGNMGADGAAMWALPASEDGAGRSSIIRRYDEGVARDGTMPAWSGEGSLGKEVGGEGNASWVLASSSNLSFIARETYYGSPDDEGTPGYRAGGALPVSLSKFRPERLDSGAVVIRWITESELNNAGFNILRSETRDGAFTKLNTNLIAGQGTISERTVYEYADTSAKPNVVYYYQIQDVSLDGQVQTLRTTHLRGNVTAAGKLTTIWAELKTLHE